MPFLETLSSGGGNDEPVPRVRDLRDDENYVLTEYEAHARKCTSCSDALDTFREGRSLCKDGQQLARDVANYVFSKQGKAYSVVDNEHNQTVLVRVPRDHKAARRLLRAIEEGLRLRHRDQTPPPIISYDQTYPVSARRPPPAEGTVTEIIERSPRRRIIIYPRSSPSRGSLYELDRRERRSYYR